MTDEEKIAFLSGMDIAVGWTPGTAFDKATVKLDMNRGPDSLDYFLMSEIVELYGYFMQLPLEHIVTPTDKFVFNILKTNGVFNAFTALNKVS